MVTGGAGGIGAGITRRLASDGHAVAIGYAAGGARAELLATELGGQGLDVAAVRCDVADEASLDACYATIDARWGASPLVVVCCGGVLVAKSVAKLTRADWDRVIGINLTGAFSTFQRAIPGMREAGWGRLLAIGSPAGSLPYLATGAYGASKAGLAQLVRVLAIELAPSNVTANVVSPGHVVTEMVTVLGSERLAAIAAGHANPTPVTPDDVGAVVAFLAGPDAAMVSGQDILVHGGGPIVTRPLPRPIQSPEQAQPSGGSGTG